jgi:hypothetical protein
MCIHSMLKRKGSLFFFSLVCALTVSGVYVPRLPAEEQPMVDYFTNTDTSFSGQAIVHVDSSGAKTLSASVLPGLDCMFSSTVENDGAMHISITLHNTGKVLSAQVDKDGDIVRMQSLTFAGKPVAFEEEDRDQLKLLARSLNPTFDDLTPVRERLATFANFIIGQFPAGAVLDIKFIKTAGQPSQRCWGLGLTTTALLGTGFVDDIRNHSLDKWLKARHWVYDSESDSICGLSYTPICDRIGTIYKDKAGWVTTLPPDDPGSITEKPHMTTYHGNHSPVGVPVKYAAEVNDDFCLGRCGPGCFGNLTPYFNTDYFNSSYFTVTAECFAHDVCIGEVGYDTLIPTGGIGNACIGEFINASWGYVNGVQCNGVAKTDVLDWWVIAGEFLFLSKQSSANGYVLQQIQNNNQLVPIGIYLHNSNTSQERYLTAIKFKGTDTSVVSWFYSGKLDTPTTVNDGLWTNDNETIATLKANKANINGTVYDAQTNKPLSGVAIQIKGDNLDTTTQTSKTDSKGNFLFLSVSPYDTYTVNLSKAGYESKSDTTKVSLESTPLVYLMIPSSKNGVHFGKTFAIEMPGANGTIETSGTISGPNAKVFSDKPGGVNFAEQVAASVSNLPGATVEIDFNSPVIKPTTWKYTSGNSTTVYKITQTEAFVSYDTGTGCATSNPIVGPTCVVTPFNETFSSGAFSISAPIFACQGTGCYLLGGYANLNVTYTWTTTTGTNESSGTDSFQVPLVGYEFWF